MPYLNRLPPDPEPIDCRIMTAALDLFAERGYHGVSVHEIRERADVAIGSIYNHFGSKEGIAKSLYTHLLGEIDEIIDQATAGHDSARAQCQYIVQNLFDRTETHTNAIAYVFHAKHAEFLPEEPPFCRSPTSDRLRAIVERGMARGEFVQVDTFVATSCLFGGMSRMIQLRLEGQLPAPLPTYLDAFMETVWTGMRARVPA